MGLEWGEQETSTATAVDIDFPLRVSGTLGSVEWNR